MFRVKAPPVDGITGKVRTEEDAELALTGKPLPSDDDEAALLIPEDEAALLQKQIQPLEETCALACIQVPSNVVFLRKQNALRGARAANGNVFFPNVIELDDVSHR